MIKKTKSILNKSMKKILRKIYINNFKHIFHMVQNSQSKYFEFDEIKLKIKKKNTLGNIDEIITTRFDQVITPNILNNGSWDLFIINFVNTRTKYTNKKFDIIDIGSNIGFITRQLLNTNKSILRSYCIEPNLNNFKIMKQNLIKFKNKVFLYNFALTNDFKKKKKLFLDNKNFGNYSLLKKKGGADIVKTLNANIFLNKIIKKNKIKNLIYKSDTQGFDEIILLNLNYELFSVIDVLIIEISNFDYLKKNDFKFLKILKNYKYKFDEYKNSLSDKEILKKISLEKEFNLLLSKF